jgi:putative PIG3 family NAD(P)H quinone oxidoreductase
MKYVGFETPGDPSVLRVMETGAPEPGPGEVLIAVEAAGVSRADTMQRRGQYPPPPGASGILGLEVAGTIAETGAGVTAWKRGDRVCALCAGGGYAEFVAVPEGQVLPIPEGWNFVEAATLPENAFTVYDNLFTRACLHAGETLLVHGGSSGIGTTAIMFGVAFGARVIATAGSPEKCRACRDLGAFAAIDYRAEDFVAAVARETGGRGADVVLDIVGGDYVARDLECLAPDGRVVCLATQRGREASFDLGTLLMKRGTIMGSSLRARTPAQKAAIARALLERVWPLLPARTVIRPLVDAVFPFEQAAAAHARLEASAHIGKIVLVPHGP